MQITAVVPMYNAAGTIERCLESIRAQSRAVAKIIVVDDCSTDGSPEFVRQLGIPNLELLRTPHNGGPGAARNLGIGHAASEFVALLDADDIWFPTFLERVSDAMEQFNADFGSAGGVRVNWSGSVRSRHLRPNGPKAVDLTDGFWRVALRFMPIHASATVVRKSLVEQVGGFPENVRIGEDAMLWVKLWVHGRFAFVDDALFESTATESGVASGPLSYHDVRLGLAGAGRALLEAARASKPGTGWFAVWYLRRLVGRHLFWVRHKMTRRRFRPIGR